LAQQINKLADVLGSHIDAMRQNDGQDMKSFELLWKEFQSC